VEEIAKIYATPTFLFSQQKIKDNLQLITTIFTELFTHSQGFYSMKANFLQPIIEIVRDNDFGVEVIGMPEMQMLQKISFPSERILAGGPYLSEDLLQSVISRNVGYLVLYNIDDIIQLERVLSSQGNKSQKILLRFQTPKYTSRHGVKVSRESIIEIASILKKCPHVDFQGILSHMGTELNSIKQYMDNIQNLISITKLFHAHSDLPIHVINIGGGFPNADALKPALFYSYLRKIKAELNRTGLTGYH
jgi:diaminopimelate decarboxylase